MAEANETVVGLCQCRDLYHQDVDKTLCGTLIQEYDIISKQLYRLKEAWKAFSQRNPKTSDI